jgi:hypothetical protein
LRVSGEGRRLIEKPHENKNINTTQENKPPFLLLSSSPMTLLSLSHKDCTHFKDACEGIEGHSKYTRSVLLSRTVIWLLLSET